MRVACSNGGLFPVPRVPDFTKIRLDASPDRMKNPAHVRVVVLLPVGYGCVAFLTKWNEPLGLGMVHVAKPKCRVGVLVATETHDPLRIARFTIRVLITLF